MTQSQLQPPQTERHRAPTARRTLRLVAGGAAALALAASGTASAFGGAGTQQQRATAPVAAPQAAAVRMSADVGSALNWHKARTGAAVGLGRRSGVLPAKQQVLESALRVDLTHETVRLPLYPGTSHGQKVWYVLLDASDQGAANNLGINYAPKLSNIGIGNPAAVQTVTLQNPTPQHNRFGPAVLDFPGAPDFRPARVATPGPDSFPLAKFAPGAVARNGYSPFIRIKGSPTVYDAPIVAVGDGPFDVDHHTNTADRALGITQAEPSATAGLRSQIVRRSGVVSRPSPTTAEMQSTRHARWPPAMNHVITGGTAVMSTA